MCCPNCCTKSYEIKVGARVHDKVSDVAPSVRINGAMLIRVKYLSDHVAVVSVADRKEGGRFYAEKAYTRKDFDATYSICRCDLDDSCRVD